VSVLRNGFRVRGGVWKIVAQVYTRDATHRPTATWTPGRGASPLSRFSRKFWEIWEIWEKSEKSRKKSKKGGFQLELEGGFRGFFSGFFRKFRGFFEKSAFFTKNPENPENPEKPPFSRPSLAGILRGWAKTGPKQGVGGGVDLRFLEI